MWKVVLAYTVFLRMSLYSSLLVPACEGGVDGKMRNVTSSFTAFLANPGEYCQDYTRQ